MKKTLAIILVISVLVSVLPLHAFASKPSISMGVKVGFMYENDSVTIKPKLRGITTDELWWSSSDTDVASVLNGKITSNKPGRTIISVKAGSASAKCGVVVLPKKLEIKVGDSYNLPYGTVEKYAVQHASIASISPKGIIKGKKAGSTLIRVKYGKQTLYIEVNVVNVNNSMQESAAAELDCASETNQIVIVDHVSGSKAKLSIHEKKSGVWRQLYSCTAYVGKNGIGKTREGDKRTPTGTFNLTQPFGIKSDPGSNMPYTKVTKYHYWCGTSGSEYYNKLVDMRETNRKNTSSDEYLINYKGVYNYCMFIDYNKDGKAGKGSCIFLHCSGSKNSTSGCIAVSESVMKKIIQWAKPGAKIVIR